MPVTLQECTSTAAPAVVECSGSIPTAVLVFPNDVGGQLGVLPRFLEVENFVREAFWSIKVTIHK